jgi:hypothetical protein
MRPPVLKGYLDRFASDVQRFFPTPKGQRRKHSTICRSGTRSSNCNHWTRLDRKAPKRLRDDNTPICCAVELVEARATRPGEREDRQAATHLIEPRN